MRAEQAGSRRLSRSSLRSPLRSVTQRAGGLIAATALAAGVLSGCTPTPGHDDPTGEGTPAATASPTQAPVSVITGPRPEEQLLAVVLVRHLENKGIPAAVGEPSAEPWGAAGEQQVAVVDTLAMATHLDPELLAGEVPTPSPSPSASGSGSPSAAGPSSAVSATASATASPSVSPSDPAPASPTGHPTATGSPTPLPEGRPAADAQGTTAMVSEYFPEDTEVIGGSSGTMRLQAVTTTALSGLYEMEDLTDLNGLCDRMVFAPASAAAVHSERLDVLAGCEPAEWIEEGEAGAALDLVSGRADVALLYGTDPAIADHALEPLGDAGRVLPEGRVLMVAEPDVLPEGASDAVNEVAGKLDGEMLAELGRLATGPDRLPSKEAAQYWLVSAGLEETPENWF
ncbi:hypothetical protein LG284_00915 [Citricoccus nitrophenolicus]|uniref:ABC-type glycine betaine transport system substrate-binding domain-containing protein n=1 Tax=Citricoccus muralis TaxID=169134 RepID=A0A3D9LBX3_9MICC|nr:hypothetical protein [Citricoccus muralis]REE03652.1 hypothetical protein C8E99_1465 [Citricoccus muralis]